MLHIPKSIDDLMVYDADILVYYGSWQVSKKMYLPYQALNPFKMSPDYTITKSRDIIFHHFVKKTDRVKLISAKNSFLIYKYECITPSTWKCMINKSPKKILLAKQLFLENIYQKCIL